jgi:hypothetical protein
MSMVRWLRILPAIKLREKRRQTAGSRASRNCAIRVKTFGSEWPRVFP